MDSRFIHTQVRDAFCYHAPYSQPNAGETIFLHSGAESPYIEASETGLRVTVPMGATYSETRSTLLAALRSRRMIGVPITHVSVPTSVFEDGIETPVKGNLIVDADFSPETVDYSMHRHHLKRSA